MDVGETQALADLAAILGGMLRDEECAELMGDLHDLADEQLSEETIARRWLRDARPD